MPDTTEKSIVTAVRIPGETRQGMNDIAKAEKNRKIQDVAAVLITEYMPIKVKLIRPALLKRTVSFGENSLSFEPAKEDLCLNVKVCKNDIEVAQIALVPDDKDSIMDLIANLLLFTNSI